MTDREAGGTSGVLWLAAAMAFIGTILEFAGLAELHYRGGHLWPVPRQAVWWVPGLNLAIQTAGLGVAWAVGRWWPAARNRGNLTGLAVGLALLSPVYTFYPRLHPAALLLIVLGVAVMATRAASKQLRRRSGRGQKMVTTVAGAIVLAIAIGATAAERRARLGNAPTPGSVDSAKRNVLLVILDTVRAIDLSLHGHDRPTTPFLERLADESVVFESAYATAPWTLPTHGSIFTGEWPNALHADWRAPLRPERTTLAELFRAAGYRTGGFTANLLYTTYASGLAQGFEHFDDYEFRPAHLLQSLAVGRAILGSARMRAAVGRDRDVGRKMAPDIRRAFVRWLDEGSTEQPFFAFLNLFDAHRPYFPPDSFLGRFTPVEARSWRAFARDVFRGRSPVGRDSTSVRAMRLRYDEAIAAIDHELEVIVDALRDRNLLDNTLVIVTGDHGELFGEHGLLTHGNSLYANVVRVPLLVWDPQDRGPHPRVTRDVSVRDLGRTILDLNQLEGDGFPGQSLRPLWTTDHGAEVSPALSMVSRVGATRAKAPVSWGDMVSVVESGLHYILNGDSTVEIYDVAADPYEQRPLDRNDSTVAARQLGALVARFWNGRASLGVPLFPPHERPPDSNAAAKARPEGP